MKPAKGPHIPTAAGPVVRVGSGFFAGLRCCFCLAPDDPSPSLPGLVPNPTSVPKSKRDGVKDKARQLAAPLPPKKSPVTQPVPSDPMPMGDSLQRRTWGGGGGKPPFLFAWNFTLLGIIHSIQPKRRGCWFGMTVGNQTGLRTKGRLGGETRCYPVRTHLAQDCLGLLCCTQRRDGSL